MDPVAAPRPHDLLRLRRAEPPVDAPAWVPDALRVTPWVVVRRAVADDGLVGVGVRGRERWQRYAWTAPVDAVVETVTPEMLAHATPTRDLPVFRALRSVRPILDGVCWGPTGSVGFELATRTRAATATSDLDIVVRQPIPNLYELLTTLDVRVDCQVETQWGAVALAELASGADDVLVRTPTGPILHPRTAL